MVVYMRFLLVLYGKKMYKFNNLVKTNIKIFIKDKTAVFFSLLSVIIMLSLYFLFLNNTYLDSLKDTNISQNLKSFLVTSQMMGGVLVISTITLSLGMMGNIVNDSYFNKTTSFLVTPIKRYKITLSYFVSGVIVTFILTLLMWFLTIVYVYINTGFLYNTSTIFIVTLLLLLYTLISTSIMIFVITFIKSVNAFGAFSGIFGTLIGFTSGIYMPLAILPSFMVKISSVLPFTHMTIYLKQILLKEPLKLIEEQVSDEGIIELTKYFGTQEIGVFGLKIGLIYIFIFIIFITLITLILTMKRMSKKSK